MDYGDYAEHCDSWELYGDRDDDGRDESDIADDIADEQSGYRIRTRIDGDHWQGE